MELIEGNGSKTREGFLRRMVKGLKELPPIHSLLKEREFNSLTRRTAKKLLSDIQEGGFLVGKQYWVYLRNSQGQNFVVITEHRPPKPWQSHTLDIEAADTNFPLGERQRSARFTLESNMYNKVPFTNSKWEGSVYCDLSIESPEGFNKEQRLSQDEQLLFLHHLLASSVDEQSTKVEYNRAQQKRGTRTTWVKGAEIDILPPR